MSLLLTTASCYFHFCVRYSPKNVSKELDRRLFSNFLEIIFSGPSFSKSPKTIDRKIEARWLVLESLFKLLLIYSCKLAVSSFYFLNFEKNIFFRKIFSIQKFLISVDSIFHSFFGDSIRSRVNISAAIEPVFS